MEPEFIALKLLFFFGTQNKETNKLDRSGVVSLLVMYMECFYFGVTSGATPRGLNVRLCLKSRIEYYLLICCSDKNMFPPASK